MVDDGDRLYSSTVIVTVRRSYSHSLARRSLRIRGVRVLSWRLVSCCAAAHLTNVTLVAEYRGPMAGSDQFMITMTDGRKVSNWQIRTVFSFVLEPFGKESIPFLIDLLNHEYEYVRWGAYYIFTSKSGRYDGRFYHSKTEEERVAIVSDWRLWWEEYNDHFSLDSSQRSRTYEATEWERVYGKDSNQTMEPTGDTRAADFY